MKNDKEVMYDFAKRLNDRMTKCGVTYRQVALAARVNRGSMIYYKSGKSFPDLWTLILIAGYLNCSVDDLLGYSSECEIGRNHLHRNSVDAAYSSFPDVRINGINNSDSFADYFRERLITAMNDTRMNVDELSDLSGLSVDKIEMYLSVHRWVPRVPELIKLCDAFQCTPSDLLGY